MGMRDVEDELVDLLNFATQNGLHRFTDRIYEALLQLDEEAKRIEMIRSDKRLALLSDHRVKSRTRSASS